MFLELIAVFVAGVAAAGVVLLLNKLLGGRLPRWFMPIGAGAAMIAATVSSEYSWFTRTSGNLPEGVIVAQSVENRAAYRPWSYLWPYTDRFVAVDRANMRSNENDPNLKLADVFVYGRWQPIQGAQIMVDCANGRRADPGDDLTAAPNWRDVGLGDPIVSTLCAEGTS